MTCQGKARACKRGIGNNSIHMVLAWGVSDGYAYGVNFRDSHNKYS